MIKSFMLNSKNFIEFDMKNIPYLFKIYMYLKSL